MMKLPEAFIERMKIQLGEEYEAFAACYGSKGCTGLRVNTAKVSVDEFHLLTPFLLEPVPWAENGFYYDKNEAVTKHPHYYAGLYYIQEPSAMLPASRLPVAPGDVVLDLCAAPGGKATELASRLGNTGLLVANDVSPSRAKALFKNLAVWGSPNCCITGETPQKLLDTFGCAFDKILVDAPCSGEGMFRKEEGLAAAWEERGPSYYAGLQKEILSCAVPMLKPGGMLLYSTCTFAREEDEDTVAWILEHFPDMELIPARSAPGLAPGYAPYENSLRAWPHKTRGEGHFLALLQKKGTPGEKTGQAGLLPVSQREVEASHAKMTAELKRFLDCLPPAVWKDAVYRQIGEQCMLVPPYQLPGKLRYLRTGVLAGTLKRGRFEPSQQLAMLLQAEDFVQAFSMPAADMRLIRYLKGETVVLSDEENARLGKNAKKTDGWILVCVDGFALGWGKYADGMIKNKYYPGWRLQ